MTGKSHWTESHFRLVDVWLGLGRWEDQGLEDDAQFQHLPLSGAVDPQNWIFRTLLCTVINWCLDYFTVDVRQAIFPLSPFFSDNQGPVLHKLDENVRHSYEALVPNFNLKTPENITFLA